MSARSSEFLTKLRDARVSTGGRDRMLLSPLVYYSEMLADLLVVPEGFITDYASVPRAPLTYWLFGGIGDEAVVVHDFLYETRTVTRDLADLVYGEALEACGVARWRRAAMVLAVQLFGGSRYGGNVAQAPSGQ